MIDISPDGFWSAGMVLAMWGMTDHDYAKIGLGATLIVLSFFLKPKPTGD